MIKRRLNRRHTVAHRHFQRRTERYPRAAVLDHLPGFLVQMGAMDELIARAQQAGTTERNQRLGIDPDMQHGPHAGLAGIGENLGVDDRVDDPFAPDPQMIGVADLLLP